jgi:hypothetical protein
MPPKRKAKRKSSKPASFKEMLKKNKTKIRKLAKRVGVPKTGKICGKIYRGETNWSAYKL